MKGHVGQNVGLREIVWVETFAHWTFMEAFRWKTLKITTYRMG